MDAHLFLVRHLLLMKTQLQVLCWVELSWLRSDDGDGGDVGDECNGHEGFRVEGCTCLHPPRIEHARLFTHFQLK